MSALWISLRRGSIVAVALLLGSGGAYSAAEEQALLIVDGAQNLFRVPRSDVSRQISYTIDLQYPARAIGEPQWEQLRDRGWIKCRHADVGVESANHDWISFADISETPGRTIHRHVTHWFKGDQLIMIGLSYYSATRNGHPRSRPDNTEQHVDLFFDDEHGRQIAGLLQLDCGQ